MYKTNSKIRSNTHKANLIIEETSAFPGWFMVFLCNEYAHQMTPRVFISTEFNKHTTILWLDDHYATITEGIFTYIGLL